MDPYLWHYSSTFIWDKYKKIKFKDNLLLLNNS